MDVSLWKEKKVYWSYSKPQCITQHLKKAIPKLSQAYFSTFHYFSFLEISWADSPRLRFFWLFNLYNLNIYFLKTRVYQNIPNPVLIMKEIFTSKLRLAMATWQQKNWIWSWMIDNWICFMTGTTEIPEFNQFPKI